MKKKRHLDSQDLRKLFSDADNDKQYEVVCYTAFNEYHIKNIVFDDNDERIIIITDNN
jgi:hypothetical protein